jgi:hypothetical protein
MNRFVSSCAVLSSLLLSPVAVAQDPPPITDSVLDDDTRAAWMVKVARMEGASVDVEEAAAALAVTAQAIADAGRVQDVALLSGQAEALKRKVISASLAAEVLDEL